MKCQRCKRTITNHKGTWFDSTDDFMCPDGEQQHKVPTVYCSQHGTDSHCGAICANRYRR